MSNYYRINIINRKILIAEILKEVVSGIYNDILNFGFFFIFSFQKSLVYSQKISTTQTSSVFPKQTRTERIPSSRNDYFNQMIFLNYRPLEKS